MSWTSSERLMYVQFTSCVDWEARFEAQFIKQLSNIEAELKKSVAYKKACIPLKPN